MKTTSKIIISSILGFLTTVSILRYKDKEYKEEDETDFENSDNKINPLDLLHQKMINDSKFSSKDIIVLRENDEEIDDAYDEYVSIDQENGYIELIIKSNDTVHKYKGDQYLEDIKSKLSESLKFGFSVKNLGFYGEYNGDHLENLRLDVLKSLELIEGFRYDSVRIYNKDVDSLYEFIRGLHPGEDGKIPFIIDYSERGISMYDNNNVLKKYLG